MKNIILPFAVVFSIATYAQKPVFTQAKVESARVYANAAELKHKATTQIPSGASEIVITNVANNLNENTLQISVPKYVTVMSVQFSNAYLEEYDNNENSPLLKPVRDSIKLVEADLKKLQNQKISEQKTIDLLDKNQQISSSQSFSVFELTKMVEYYKKERNSLSNSVDQLSKKEIELQEKLNGLKGRLAFNQTNIENVSNGKLIVNVMSNQAGNIPLEISYLTNSAYWKPSYELRIDKINDPIQMLYKAQVIQYTGVDWKNVKLSLTSGLANANTIAPELDIWFLNYANYTTKTFQARPNATYIETLQNQVPGLDVETSLSKSSSVKLRGIGSAETADVLYVIDGVPMSEDSFRTINKDEIVNIEVLKDAGATSIYGNRGANGVIVVTTKAGMGVSTMDEYTELNESQLNLTFDIDIPYTILSNQKWHSVSLKEIKLPATYSYVAIPKLDLNAYLIAKIKDYGNYNILPGEANVVFEDVFVGKTYINPNVKNNELRLSLGKDSNIIISKTLISDKSGTKMLSSRKVQDFMYEILVRNNKKQPIDIVIEDQIPISTNNDIEVLLTEKDGAEVNSETGKLTWNLNVKPNETKKIKFGYQLKSAKDKRLNF